MRISPKSATRRGAAAVEFAVAATVLFMVVFASIEFVRLSIIRHSVEDASYAAARQAIITGATAAEAEQAALDHLAIFDVKQAVVTVTPNPLVDNTEQVEIHVQAPIGPNAWIVPEFFTSDIVGSTRMLAERSAGEMQEASTKATKGRKRKPAKSLGNGNGNGNGNGTK